MRKLLFIMILSALFLTACAVSQEEVSEPIQITESVSETVPEETKPVSKPDFSSAEKIEAISDEDLITLYDYWNHHTDSSAFIPDYTTIDFFGRELTEAIRIITPDYREKDHIPELIQKEVHRITDTDEINKGKKLDNGDTVYEARDVNLILCGENDDYIEYSLCYTDVRQRYHHSELITEEFPRATRYVYLKNVLYDEENNQYHYTGEMSAEAVHSAIDLANQHMNLFRTVTETEYSFDYLCYYYHMVGGDYGLNSSGTLKKRIISIDKETGIITNLDEGQPEEVIIRKCEIPGTAYWYEEEGKTP